jgi:hypothetical protein
MRLLPLVSMVALGCGAPYPYERVTSATAALRTASDLGAALEPDAAPVLERARAEIAEAQALLDDGHYGEAESQLIRAEADANLAAALAKKAPLRREADRLRARLEALRSQNRM